MILNINSMKIRSILARFLAGFFIVFSIVFSFPAFAYAGDDDEIEITSGDFVNIVKETLEKIGCHIYYYRLVETAKTYYNNLSLEDPCTTAELENYVNDFLLDCGAKHIFYSCSTGFYFDDQGDQTYSGAGHRDEYTGTASDWFFRWCTSVSIIDGTIKDLGPKHIGSTDSVSLNDIPASLSDYFSIRSHFNIYNESVDILTFKTNQWIFPDFESAITSLPYSYYNDYSFGRLQYIEHMRTSYEYSGSPSCLLFDYDYRHADSYPKYAGRFCNDDGVNILVLDYSNPSQYYTLDDYLGRFLSYWGISNFSSGLLSIEPSAYMLYLNGQGKCVYQGNYRFWQVDSSLDYANCSAISSSRTITSSNYPQFTTLNSSLDACCIIGNILFRLPEFDILYWDGQLYNLGKLDDVDSIIFNPGDGSGSSSEVNNISTVIHNVTNKYITNNYITYVSGNEATGDILYYVKKIDNTLNNISDFLFSGQILDPLLIKLDSLDLGGTVSINNISIENIVNNIDEHIESSVTNVYNTMFIMNDEQTEIVNSKIDRISNPFKWIGEFGSGAKTFFNRVGASAAKYSTGSGFGSSSSFDFFSGLSLSSASNNSVINNNVDVSNFSPVTSGSAADIPSVTIDFTKSNSDINYGGEAVILDLSWYAPYKPLVDRIIILFCWALAFWRIFKSIPSLLSGADGVNGANERAEMRAKR